MVQQFERLDGTRADLVVIGGGITGAGIAWDAGLRGIDTLLFEQRDFASGTSSRSSKLIHGGLRYLEQREFKLVFEAVNERTRLRKLARHLVRPLGFVFPRYAGQWPGVWVMRMGLLVYETMTGFRVDRMHRRLNREQTVGSIPGLLATGLNGAVHYFDAKAADARLVWENILGARQAGVGCFNYTKVVGLEPGEGGRWWVTVADQYTGETATVDAATVVAAVGPWGNVALKEFFPELESRVRPSKGIHLVLPADKLPLSDAVALQHPEDKRVTFVIPGRHYVYCGTTDTDYEGDVAEPGVTRQDVDYLLRELNHYFPDRHFSDADVTATWSGLRPLVEQDGKANAYQVSREHEIKELRPGVFSVEGGKLTTYRVMAEQAVDAAVAVLRQREPGRAVDACRTKDEPLPGCRGIHEEAQLEGLKEQVTEYLGGDETVARHLVRTYGMRVTALLPYVEAEPRRPLPALPYTWGELQFVLEHEDVWALEDLYLRRTEIYYQDPDNGRSLAPELARRLAGVRGLDAAWQDQAVAAYEARIAHGMAFKQIAAGTAGGVPEPAPAGR